MKNWGEGKAFLAAICASGMAESIHRLSKSRCIMTPDMIRRVCPKARYVDQIAARLMLLTSVVPG